MFWVTQRKIRILGSMGSALLFASLSITAMIMPIHSARATESAVPNGRVLQYDLQVYDELSLLKHGDSPAIYAVETDTPVYQPNREPVVLVHGIDDDFRGMQAILNRFRNPVSPLYGRFQLYVLAYDDYNSRATKNGIGFAKELQNLYQTFLSKHTPLTIIAHSFGGVITRLALNEMTIGRTGGIQNFSSIRFFSMDTPWHGFIGPADTGLGRLAMALVSPFMADGLEEMRAKSALFQGKPHSRNPALRAGLYNVPLPSNVWIDLSFAESGDQTYDYSEADLKDLAKHILDQFAGSHAAGVPLTPSLNNYWNALQASHQYLEISAQLTARSNVNSSLSIKNIQELLERNFRKFPGNHATVISEQPEVGCYLDYLEAQLGNVKG